MFLVSLESSGSVESIHIWIDAIGSHMMSENRQKRGVPMIAVEEIEVSNAVVKRTCDEYDGRRGKQGGI